MKVVPLRRYFSLFAAVLACILSVSASANDVVDIELTDLAGEKHHLSDYRGKWVIVNYWATWCPPCLEEMPDLDQFHAAHKDDDAVVLGINMEDIKMGDLRDFLDGLLIDYPIYHVKPAPYTELGMIRGMPTTFIVSPEGVVVASQTGSLEAKHLEAFLERKKRQRAEAK